MKLYFKIFSKKPAAGVESRPFGIAVSCQAVAAGLLAFLLLASCATTDSSARAEREKEYVDTAASAAGERESESGSMESQEEGDGLSRGDEVKKSASELEKETAGPQNCRPESLAGLNRLVSGKVIEKGGKRFFPVFDSSRPVLVSGDFVNDGCPEYYILFSEGENREEVTKAAVSDMKNIYMENVSLRQYLLLSYVYIGGDSKDWFREKGIISLEGRGAFQSLGKVRIDRGKNIYSLSASFATSEGVFEDLVTFDGKGGHSVKSIRNTISDYTRKADIDEDGKIELLRYEQLFVDGSGAETFITMFRFDGKGFRPVKTVNTVRDLRQFLEQAESLLERKNAKGFIDYAVAPDVLSSLRSASISPDRILRRIFYPAKKDDSTFMDVNEILESEGGVDFIFPEILESPFRPDMESVYSFTTYVRASLKGAATSFSGEAENRQPAEGSGDSVKSEEIYFVRIYMAENPFSGRRYFFTVH